MERLRQLPQMNNEKEIGHRIRIQQVRFRGGRRRLFRIGNTLFLRVFGIEGVPLTIQINMGLYEQQKKYSRFFMKPRLPPLNRAF